MWFRYGKIWLKYKKYYRNIKYVIKVQKCDNGIEMKFVIRERKVWSWYKRL